MLKIKRQKSLSFLTKYCQILVLLTATYLRSFIKKDLSENSLVLFEEWESTAHFNEYIAWRKNIGDFDRLGAMLTDMPAITVMSKIVTTPEVE